MPADVDIELREQTRRLCARYPTEYWQKLDRARTYPEEFVQALTDAGYLACLIPDEYGGPGLGIREAAVILEEIHRSGGNAAACHALPTSIDQNPEHSCHEQPRRGCGSNPGPGQTRGWHQNDKQAHVTPGNGELNSQRRRCGTHGVGRRTHRCPNQFHRCSDH